MKFGLLVEQETRNIGDDIQAYAAKRFLPRIDYFVDRNHIDNFVPDNEELVATITNGWFLQYTLNWPPSPFIKPFPVSIHFTNKDWFWDTTDRAYHLQGYGLDYLKKIGPIGCRDSHTLKLLSEKGVKTEYTGCLTLTIERFNNVKTQNYICAVDVSDEVVKKIKRTTDMEVKVITHSVPEDYYKLSWDERFKRVEDLLKIYQGAKAVITFRLHCALPCLALGTPVILLNEDYRNDRFGDYIEYLESCSEEDFIQGKANYDYNNIPKHNTGWTILRDNLIKKCNEVVENCINSKEEYGKDNISLINYKEYIIKKSNWLKEVANESYQRYKKECEINVSLEKKYSEEINIKNEELYKKEQEVIEKNIEIQNLEAAKDYYHNEFDECVKKMEQYKNELEKIKSSKWFKFREKIIGGMKNG